MFKNESLILEEWVKYYIDQGVEHFYLIDNGSNDDYETKINKYMDKITLIKDNFRVKPNTNYKLKLYDNNKKRYVFKKVLNGARNKIHTQSLLSNKYFLEKIKNESIWTMYIDCDEYIYAPGSKSINNLLIDLDKNNKYNKITDIFIPWKIFGSNNLYKQPNSIINGFNKRMKCKKLKNRALKQGDIRGHGKSITRTKYLKILGNHKCRFYIPSITLMPDYSMINNNNKLRRFMMKLRYKKHFIHCNHYMLMSKEYFLKYKSQRERGGSYGGKREKTRRGNSYWKKNNHNDTVDNMLINIMKRSEKI
tara:strand:- start:516 stop:1436 length:921 start_codon:yes stop_codon:yes gene_type:complete